jgi:hypothetical protein
VAEDLSPVTELSTVTGSIGYYSSYIGLVRNYSVGFAILTAGNETSADLNAYADFTSDALQPALEKPAIVHANISYARTFTSSEFTITIVVDGCTVRSETPTSVSWMDTGDLVYGGVAG